MINALRGFVLGMSFQLIISESEYARIGLVIFLYTLLHSAYYIWQEKRREKLHKLDWDKLLIDLYNRGYHFSNSTEHKNCYVIEFDEIYDDKKYNDMRLYINSRLRDTNCKIYAVALNEVMKRFEITISKPHLQ